MPRKKQEEGNVFPSEAKINKYGFLGLRDKILRAMNLPLGVDIPVTLSYLDGVLTVTIPKEQTTS